MPDLSAELTQFMSEYERANNSHDIDRVTPLIADDATYWFSDGSYRGLHEIAEAIQQTFSTIQNEVYEIEDVEWVVLTADTAVSRYRFKWKGVVKGEPCSGQGRDTNVVVKHDGLWKMQHEHLST